MSERRFYWMLRHKKGQQGCGGNWSGTYATVYRIPQLTSYAEWVDKYAKTKPVRGRDETWRPLATRRAIDTLAFSTGRCHQRGKNYVAFRMHNVVLMRWYEDDSVGVMNRRGWLAGMGCEVLNWIIPNMLGAYTRKGCVMAKYATEKRHFESELGVEEAPVVAIPTTTTDEDWFTFTKEGDYFVPQANVNKRWGINRQKAKDVEKIYKKFTTYVRMCMNLAKSEEREEIAIIKSELVDKYATSPTSYLYRNIDLENNEKFRNYLRHWQSLALSGDAEKMQDAMGMFLSTQAPNRWGIYARVKLTVSDGVFFNIQHAMNELREVILRAHAEDVLELKDVKVGVTPSTKYDDWALGPASKHSA